MIESSEVPFSRHLDALTRLSVIASASLVVSGCVNPSAKIATELTRYGLDQRQSQCVGDRLEAHLSIGQLQQLGRAARAVNEGDTTPGRLTVSDLIRVASRFDDARVPLEVAKAAGGCGVLTGAGSRP